MVELKQVLLSSAPRSLNPPELFGLPRSRLSGLFNLLILQKCSTKMAKATEKVKEKALKLLRNDVAVSAIAQSLPIGERTLYSMKRRLKIELAQRDRALSAASIQEAA